MFYIRENNYKEKTMKKDYKYRDLVDFIKGDETEEKFLINKEDLLLLKDYLLELKQTKNNYIKRIEEPLKSIQSKNRWVKEVYPSFRVTPRIVLAGKNDPVIGCSLNNVTGKYEHTAGWVHVPMVGDIRLKNRVKVLDNSQEELHEIGQVIDDVFDKSKYGSKIYSASGLFYIDCDYRSCLIGNDGVFLLCDYDLDTLKFSSSYLEKNELTETLTSKNYESLMEKVYIKKN